MDYIYFFMYLVVLPAARELHAYKWPYVSASIYGQMQRGMCC